MKARRRPVRGFFAGGCFGLGLALVLFVFGVLPMTVLWLGVLCLGCAVLGIGLAYVVPARRGGMPA